MIFFIFTTFGVFLRIHLAGGSIQCGSREHSMVGLVHHGWKINEGQWPWHVALFHDGTSTYACGATLLSQWHVLTAAHCVTYRRQPLPAGSIVLHFGQKNLSEITSNVQIRHVGKVHVHPNYSRHKNDIALLVLRSSIEYSEFVLPICLDKRADSDLRNLESTRGWIPGWGRTENGLTSDVLRTVSMPVVSYIECLQADRILFGHVLDPNVFCAGDRNGSSPGFGDSGGGMYFSDDDRWVLRGIVSFAKVDEARDKVDTSKYTVFVNVQRYLSWISDKMEEDITYLSPRRTSEKECDRFEKLARNQVAADGDCSDDIQPQVISIFYSDGKVHCNGVLLNEDSVLTTCRCVRRKDVLISLSIQIGTLDRVNILSTHCHPDYRPDQLYHNLAVLKLNSSVALSSSLVPTCLASNWTDYLDAGSDLHTGIESGQRHVISNDICNQTVTERRMIPKGFPLSLMCVNNTDHQLTTDSWENLGAPALQSFDRKRCLYTLVGVPCESVRGQQDSEAFRLDVYTRVAYYLGWIEGVASKRKVQTFNEPTTEKPRSTESWRFTEIGRNVHAPRDFYPLSLPSFPTANSKPGNDEFSIPAEISLFFKVVFIFVIVSFIASICVTIFCLTQLRTIVTSVFKK
ncbi:polyserase-2-like [Ochlerotatus camptorhynchus]|uniref:polyserase-2-like n=1 Tax=Ochlerotatus camptorhynchus TaxID=644619 RepID=UPI0031E072A0